MKVGDILSYNFGCCSSHKYYVCVVRTTKSFAFVKRLMTTGDFNGNVIPVENNFTSGVIRYKIHNCIDGEFLMIDGCYASLYKAA